MAFLQRSPSARAEHAARLAGCAEKAALESGRVRGFRLGEDLRLRYERVARVYLASVHAPQMSRARVEAARVMRTLGKKIETDGDLFFAEVWKAYERIKAEAPKDDLTREFESAEAALIAAVNGLPSASPN
jgi:hypothetical protein